MVFVEDEKHVSWALLGFCGRRLSGSWRMPCAVVDTIPAITPTSLRIVACEASQTAWYRVIVGTK